MPTMLVQSLGSFKILVVAPFRYLEALQGRRCKLLVLALIGTFLLTAPAMAKDKSRNDAIRYKVSAYIKNCYDSLSGEFAPPSYEVFEKAMIGYLNLQASGQLNHGSLLAVIDFTKHSKEQRLWIIDTNAKKILLRSLVAHGRNSGLYMAEQFSNTPQSYQSSLGFYITGKTYYGKHGKSLYLHGKEEGINHKAFERAIVIHAADYVTRDFVAKNGRTGRSHGCPAIPPRHLEKVVNWLEEGNCLFAFYRKPTYWEKTKLQNWEKALQAIDSM